MALDRSNAIGGELGLGGPAAEDITVDITGMDAAQTATDLQGFLAELEARVTAVE